MEITLKKTLQPLSIQRNHKDDVRGLEFSAALTVVIQKTKSRSLLGTALAPGGGEGGGPQPVSGTPGPGPGLRRGGTPLPIAAQTRALLDAHGSRQRTLCVSPSATSAVNGNLLEPPTLLKGPGPAELLLMGRDLGKPAPQQPVALQPVPF